MAVIAGNRVILEQSRGTYALVSTATYFAVTSVSLSQELLKFLTWIFSEIVSSYEAVTS